MPGGRGSVQAQAEALNSMFFQPGDSLSGQFRSGAGSDGDLKPKRDGIVDQRKDIFTAQRISSGKDQMGKGLSEGKQLSKKRFTLKGRELLGMWVGAASARQCLQARPQAWVTSQ